MNQDQFISMPIIKPACYMLIKNRIVVYVGLSRNIYDRLGKHIYKLYTRKYFSFDEINIVSCNDADLEALEVAMIRYFKPKHNKQSLAWKSKPLTIFQERLLMKYGFVEDQCDLPLKSIYQCEFCGKVEGEEIIIDNCIYVVCAKCNGDITSV